MKKYILSIFLILICYFGFGQWPITQNLGSGNTLVQVPANGGLRANLINRSYADTTSANLGYSDSYPGSLIFTTDIQAMWLRNAAADGWIQIMPSGGTGGQRPWLISGNSGLFTSPVDPQYVGTLTNQPFGVLSNGVARLTWNTSGAFGIGSGLSYGNSGEVLTSAGSGAPPTWAAAAASGWALTGNSGTTAGTNFVGTTDNVDLVFKRNSTEAGRIGSSNTSFGLSSLVSNVGGSRNVAIGNEALVSLTSGDENTAVGYRALYSSDGENNHIGIGSFAGAYTTTGGNELYINSIDRGSFINDTTLSIIYGVQSAAGADQRLRLNSRVFADYLPSGVGDKSVRWNSTTKEFTYADTTASGGSGANTALSNLASVAINTSLISDADNTDDLGSTSVSWRTGYFGTTILPDANDGAQIGSTTRQWSDLFLAEGGVINWDNG